MFLGVNWCGGGEKKQEKEWPLIRSIIELGVIYVVKNWRERGSMG
jgi:hypothetical protein